MSSHELTAANGEGQPLFNNQTTRFNMNRPEVYEAAFLSLSAACFALRRFMVTLQRVDIIQKEALQPMFKKLKAKYFQVHMNGQMLGVNTGFCPGKKNQDET